MEIYYKPQDWVNNSLIVSVVGLFFLATNFVFNFLKERAMLLAYLFYRFAMPRYLDKKRDEDETWLLGAEAWVSVGLVRR